jgi:hypothetical protein
MNKVRTSLLDKLSDLRILSENFYVVVAFLLYLCDHLYLIDISLHEIPKPSGQIMLIGAGKR